MTPAGVIRPIRCSASSVNQRLPSGPAVIAVGSASRRRERELGDHARGGDPTDRRPGLVSVNQRLPSGPAVMLAGPTVDQHRRGDTRKGDTSDPQV